MRKTSVPGPGAWVPSAKAAEKEIRRTRRLRYHRHRMRVLLALMILSALAGFALNRWVFQIVTIHDTSMSPALESGSVVLCLRQDFLDRTVGLLPERLWRIQRQDMVLVDYRSEDDPDAGARLLIKRVAGVGGDVIELDDGVAMLDGQPLAWLGETSDRVYPYTVPSGRLFLLGDNASTSLDSRRRSFGVVQEADVTGRPVAVIWPVYAARALKQG